MFESASLMRIRHQPEIAMRIRIKIYTSLQIKILGFRLKVKIMPKKVLHKNGKIKNFQNKSNFELILGLLSL